MSIHVKVGESAGLGNSVPDHGPNTEPLFRQRTLFSPPPWLKLPHGVHCKLNRIVFMAS